MKFYKVEQLSELLQLSSSQIYSLIASAKLKCHRLTTGRQGAVRVSQAQLDAFLKATEEGGESIPLQNGKPQLKHLNL